MCPQNIFRKVTETTGCVFHTHAIFRHCWSIELSNQFLPVSKQLSCQWSAGGFLCTRICGSFANLWSLWCFLPPLRVLFLRPCSLRLLLSRSEYPPEARPLPASEWWCPRRCSAVGCRSGSGGRRDPEWIGLCSGVGDRSSSSSSSLSSPRPPWRSWSLSSAFATGGGGVVPRDLGKGALGVSTSEPRCARRLPAPGLEVTGIAASVRDNPAPKARKALTCLTQLRTKSAARTLQPLTSQWPKVHGPMPPNSYSCCTNCRPQLPGPVYTCYTQVQAYSTSKTLFWSEIPPEIIMTLQPTFLEKVYEYL